MAPWASLLIAVTAATEPSGTSVLLSRATDVPDEGVRAHGERAVELLRRAGAPVRAGDGLGWKDARGCAADRACLAETGRKLQAAFVLTLELAQLLGDFAAHAELLRASDGAVLETVDIVGPAQDAHDLMDAQLLPLVQKASSLSVSPPPAPPSDAPWKPATGPEPPQEEQPSRLLRPKVMIAGGASLAAALSGGAFALRGMDQRARYESLITSREPLVFGAPREEAEARRAAANQSFTVAAISAGVSVALGVVTAALFATD